MCWGACFIVYFPVNSRNSLKLFGTVGHLAIYCLILYHLDLYIPIPHVGNSYIFSYIGTVMLYYTLWGVMGVTQILYPELHGSIFIKLLHAYISLWICVYFVYHKMWSEHYPTVSKFRGGGSQMSLLPSVWGNRSIHHLTDY